MMAASVIFLLICSGVGVAAGAGAIFGMFALRRYIQNRKQKQSEESENVKE